MAAQDQLDDLFGWMLIYEGGVLGVRRVRPDLRFPPAVSNLVWRLPRPVRSAVALGICVYLFLHFMSGPRAKPALVPADELSDR